MSIARTDVYLPKDYCEERKLPFLEFSQPRPLVLVEKDLYDAEVQLPCGLAHAFVCRVDDVRVFGPGFILAGDGPCLVHGLTHANYPRVVGSLIEPYVAKQIAGSTLELNVRDDAPHIDDDAVLLWGSKNFGHWIFTYLHRLILLAYHPELKNKKVLVPDDMPERYLPWLVRMGIAEELIVRVPDWTRVSRLWVPSVLHYRGHYEDLNVYTFPDAVRLFRKQILGPSAPQGGKRERIYLSRAKAAWRRVVNEDELTARLAALNVRRIFMEEMSLEEQIDVISRAELIVLATGGVGPITMLAPEDARIIELSLPGFAGVFGSRVWAAILKQRFSRVDVQPVNTGNVGPFPETDRDGIVPVAEVVELIKAADRR